MRLKTVDNCFNRITKAIKLCGDENKDESEDESEDENEDESEDVIVNTRVKTIVEQ